MIERAYRFEFDTAVDLDEVELTFGLATYSAEGLYGAARVRLEAAYERDEMGRALTVSAETPVGVSVIRIFAGLLAREFGEDSFRVNPIPSTAAQDTGVVIDDHRTSRAECTDRTREAAPN